MDEKDKKILKQALEQADIDEVELNEAVGGFADSCPPSCEMCCETGTANRGTFETAAA